MKTNIFKSIALSGIIAFTVSCKNEKEAETTDEKEVAEATQEAVTYEVDTDESKIMWTGSKVGGSHNGVIMIKDGMVKVKGDSLQAGEFTIDMTTIEVQDLEGEDKQKLEGHLSSDDFYHVEEYPEANFEVTGLSSKDGATMLSGNLTMKGQTQNITFPVDVNYEGDKMMLDSEEFAIDRTKWGIKYGSESLADVAKDKAISDDIELQVSVVANKS